MMKRLVLLVLASLLCAALQVAHPSPASADLRLCNKYSSEISVALAYYSKSSGEWISEGWWVVEPDACKTPLSGDLNERYYYVYAYSAESGTWSGDYYFCMAKPDEFKFTSADDESSCDSSWQGFRKIDTESYTDYEYSFTP